MGSGFRMPLLFPPASVRFRSSRNWTSCPPSRISWCRNDILARRSPTRQAETELGLVLRECGFTIVDERSTAKPDVEITGEAFSAFGLRRGNLISCKARVEVKAHARKDGKVLAVDRETNASVDITEQTAAKTALQLAAAELAERLAPKLILDSKVAAQ